MPTGWQEEAQRLAYYQLLPQPVQVTSFLDPLRARLTPPLPSSIAICPRIPMSISRRPPPMRIVGCLLSSA